MLGPISDEMKQHFTAVCRSNMKLANAKFLYGACGSESGYSRTRSIVGHGD